MCCVSMSPRGLPLLKEVLKNLKCRKPNMPFYAVARGREVGVFQSWDVCQDLISNFKGAKYKKFDCKDKAWDFVKQFRFKYGKVSEDAEHDASVSKIVNTTAASSAENKNDEGSSSRFDFAAFNLRLTNLENSYQEKIRSLEERLEALEDDRGMGNSGGQKIKDKREEDVNTVPSSSGTHNISATKRKLLDSATEIVKPGSSRAFSTSALKRLKTCESKSIRGPEEPIQKEIPFLIDSEGFVIVYTDGACSKNGNGLQNARAGIGVWFNEGHPLNVTAPVHGRATNNVAELQAAKVAAEVAAGSGIQKLCIMTDSQFAINCMTSWIHMWKKNDWKTNKREPVINKGDVLAVEKACNLLEAVKWVYVRGHQGIHGNERADMLARNGADQYRYDKHSEND